MSRRVSAERAGRHPKAILAAAAFSVALLTGCAAGPEAAGTPAAGSPSALRDSSGSVPLAVGSRSPAPSLSPSDVTAAAGSPSAEAKMVCADETRTNITRILSLPASPATTDSWVDKLYTCTYALPAGSLVLSVKEAADPTAARAHFEGLQRATAGAAPIEGLANLGFPAFQTPASAIFVKDNFVLTVDAGALPETLGPHQVTRAAFAYQVATTVLACWSE